MLGAWPSATAAEGHLPAARPRAAARSRTQPRYPHGQEGGRELGRLRHRRHRRLKCLWKPGEKQKFIVTAQPTNNPVTISSGDGFHPEQQWWMLISSRRVPKDGGWLRGLYTFSENFGGQNGYLRRKAPSGNQWLEAEFNLPDWLWTIPAHDGVVQAIPKLPVDDTLPAFSCRAATGRIASASPVAWGQMFALILQPHQPTTNYHEHPTSPPQLPRRPCRSVP